ncbi:hypothetical protein X772_09075 [Mesorhizobium sp. LSJC280B00]|nr:hypothetical protein X772_09075 [Mesorhizobium sp. LSJC280B00]
MWRGDKKPNFSSAPRVARQPLCGRERSVGNWRFLHLPRHLTGRRAAAAADQNRHSRV